MSCKDVQENIKCAVGIEVKVANEADDSAPNGCGPFMNCLSRFDGQTCSGRVWWANAAGDFGDQFAVSFCLFPQEVNFVLLVAGENVSVGRRGGRNRTNKRLVLVRTSRLSQYDLSKLRPAANTRPLSSLSLQGPG